MSAVAAYGQAVFLEQPLQIKGVGIQAGHRRKGVLPQTAFLPAQDSAVRVLGDVSVLESPTLNTAQLVIQACERVN